VSEFRKETLGTFGFRYPVALFNELYYLNAGGTIWTGNCDVGVGWNDQTVENKY
jgi:hypothetical protein